MIVRQPGEGTVDLLAVARDDELLDRLAGREDAAAPEDRAAALLRELTADVDRDLARLLALPLGTAPDQPPGPAVDAPVDLPTGADPEETAPDGVTPLRRRRAVRGTAVALLVAAGLSVGGVSAAVTGDPFAAYRSVSGLFDIRSELPPNAAAIAQWNKRLASARAAARGGPATQAQVAGMIDVLQSELDALDLQQSRRDALQRKLDRLEAQLDRGAARPGSAERPQTPPGASRQEGAQRAPFAPPGQKGQRGGGHPDAPAAAGERTDRSGGRPPVG